MHKARIKPFLESIAQADGKVCEKERETIDRIMSDLESFSDDVALPHELVLGLAFDVAIADSSIHELELEVLESLVESSTTLSSSLERLCDAFHGRERLLPRIRALGLKSDESSLYRCEDAVVDACTLMKRRGAAELRILLNQESRAVLVAGAAPTWRTTSHDEDFISGVQDDPVARGVVTASRHSLELHLSAAGGLVADAAMVISRQQEDIAMNSIFSASGEPRLVSAPAFDWARNHMTSRDLLIGVLFEGVNQEHPEQEWRNTTFRSIRAAVDSRLHRWTQSESPGGPCRVFVIQNELSALSDPFRKEALRFPPARRIVQPRSSLILDLSIFERKAVDFELARRLSPRSDVERFQGKDGLWKGVPSPGLFLYDDIGRCILREYIPDDLNRLTGEKIASEVEKRLRRNRIRLDVVERPKSVRHLETLHFKDLWTSIAEA